MRKGSALSAIFVIVIAIVAFAFLVPPCTLTNSCTSGPHSSNDIITIGYTSLNPKNPQPGTNVIWQMDLVNNADNDHFKMDGILLHFFGNIGLNITNSSLDCRDGTKTSDVDCIFDNFYQFEKRTVFLTTNVLPNIQPGSGIPLVFKYFVNYDYNSTRSASFPIIDNTLSQPTGFFHQDPTPAPTNPVSLNYQPLYTVQREVNGQTINDSWAMSGSQFYINLNFRLATFQSFSCEKSPCETAIIPAGKLKIDFTLSSNFIKLNYCNCVGGPSSTCLDNPPGTFTLVSNQPINVTKSAVLSLQCSFDANTNGSPEQTGRIETTYDVIYQFENMKSFSPG